MQSKRERKQNVFAYAPAVDYLWKMVIALKHETLFHVLRKAYKLNISLSCPLKQSNKRSSLRYPHSRPHNKEPEQWQSSNSKPNYENIYMIFFTQCPIRSSKEICKCYSVLWLIFHIDPKEKVSSKCPRIKWQLQYICIQIIESNFRLKCRKHTFYIESTSKPFPSS